MLNNIYYSDLILENVSHNMHIYVIKTYGNVFITWFIFFLHIVKKQIKEMNVGDQKLNLINNIFQNHCLSFCLHSFSIEKYKAFLIVDDLQNTYYFFLWPWFMSMMMFFILKTNKRLKHGAVLLLKKIRRQTILI